jgi:hypothetical protein
MSHETQFEHEPAGYAASDRTKGDTADALRMTGFSSSDSRETLFMLLYRSPADVIRTLPARACVHESSAEHLPAIVRQGKTATVFVRELYLRGTFQVKR